MDVDRTEKPVDRLTHPLSTFAVLLNARTSFCKIQEQLETNRLLLNLSLSAVEILMGRTEGILLFAPRQFRRKFNHELPLLQEI